MALPAGGALNPVVTGLLSGDSIIMDVPGHGTTTIPLGLLGQPAPISLPGSAYGMGDLSYLHDYVAPTTIEPEVNAFVPTAFDPAAGLPPPPPPPTPPSERLTPDSGGAIPDNAGGGSGVDSGGAYIKYIDTDPNSSTFGEEIIEYPDGGWGITSQGAGDGYDEAGGYIGSGAGLPGLYIDPNPEFSLFDPNTWFGSAPKTTGPAPNPLDDVYI